MGGSRAQGPDGGVPIGALTPHEFQVARLVADGLSNVEVAAALYLSRMTVEAHLSPVYGKLGLRSGRTYVRD